MFCSATLIITSYLISKALGIVVDAGTVLPSYDYVVIGGGMAGITVGARLAEDSNVNVLLIEDGDFDDGAEDIFVPAIGIFNPYGRYARVVTSVPQPQLNESTRDYGVAKVFAGGTIVNGQLFIRGTYTDYDVWETLGNEGWNWNNLLPYFKKSETFTPEVNATIAQEYYIGYNSSAHGLSGPVQVGFGRYFWPQSINYFQGAALAGVPTVLDANDGSKAGAKFTPMNIDPHNFTRFTARDAYWTPNSARQNFHLLLNTTVTRVIATNTTTAPSTTTVGANLTVTQVEFAASANESRFLVNVTQEAILAAGAIFSPQILHLSGFGPRSLLESLGIKVLVDLPGIGENLMDHAIVQTNADYENITDSPRIRHDNATIRALDRELYFANRTGSWTATPSSGNLYPSLRQISNRSSELLAKVSTQNAADFYPEGTDKTVIAGYQETLAVNAKLLDNVDTHHHQVINDNAGGWQVLLLHPFSRGYVRASSNDPFSDPEYSPNYVKNPVDLELYLEAILWNRKLIDTPPMQLLQPNETYPKRDASDDEIRGIIKNGVRTAWHGSGTCAMRPRSKGGVVNNRLVVYGTSNLRVVDASIFPLIPAANTMASLYATAEKAAAIIKEDAASRKQSQSRRDNDDDDDDDVVHNV